jgi:hypothetical protein
MRWKRFKVSPVTECKSNLPFLLRPYVEADKPLGATGKTNPGLHEPSSVILRHTNGWVLGLSKRLPLIKRTPDGNILQA